MTHFLVVEIDGWVETIGSWLGQLDQRCIVDVLAAIQVQFFQVKWVRVVCNNRHGVLVDELAVAQTQNL